MSCRLSASSPQSHFRPIRFTWRNSKAISLASTTAAGLPTFSEFYTNHGRVPVGASADIVGINAPGSETESCWNALNNANFHSNIDYFPTAIQARFTTTLAGVDGNVNTKKIDFIFEDIDGNMKLVCKRHPGLGK